MYATYQIKSDELTYEFIDILKSNFKNKLIEISVCDIDETDYLTSLSKNNEILLKRIENIKNQINIVTPNQEIFQ